MEKTEIEDPNRGKHFFFFATSGDPVCQKMVLYYWTEEEMEYCFTTYQEKSATANLDRKQMYANRSNGNTHKFLKKSIFL